MATRKSNRRTKHPIKLKDFVLDHFVAESTTPQQMSVAVKRELCQVESLIKDLTTTSFKEEQPTVNDRATKDLRNRDLQLELDLTQTKLEQLQLQRESTQQSAPKMVSATATMTPDGNFVAKTSLKSLQQDPVVQSELKYLMDSLRDPYWV